MTGEQVEGLEVLHPPPYDVGCRQVGLVGGVHLHLPVAEAVGLVHDHARPQVAFEVLVVDRPAEAVLGEAAVRFEELIAERAAIVAELDIVVDAWQARRRADGPEPQ